MTDTLFHEYRNNPIKLLNLLNKYVCVKLINNVSYTGFVYSIDPLHFSIILTVVEENKTLIFPGHAIKELILIKQDPLLLAPKRLIKEELTEDEISDRKIKLLAWLKKNLLPVSEVGDNITVANVHIIPPYRSTDICAPSPVVVLQIRKIVENMPSNFTTT